MDHHLDRQTLDAFTGEQELQSVVDSVYSMGKRFIQAIQHQQDQMDQMRSALENEISTLQKDLELRNNEFEQMHRALTEAQAAQAESRRAQESLQQECQRLNDTLGRYQKDVEQLEALSRQMAVIQEENQRLRGQIEERRLAEHRLQQSHKEAMEELSVQFEKEKMKFQDRLQMAEDGKQSLQTVVERHKAMQLQAEQDRDRRLEEADRLRQDEKAKREQLMAQVSLLQSQLADLERSTQEFQREQEHRTYMTLTKAAQEHRTQMEQLKKELEKKTREATLLAFQRDQDKENHRKAIEAMRQEFNQQINIRADEIRRQCMIRSRQELLQDPSML